jgi:SAM-dependent methyltransferase
LACAYDAIYAKHELADRARFYRWVAHRAGLSPGRRVLDLGCGTGGAAAAASAHGAQVVAIDLSSAALRLAATKHGWGLPWIQADGSRLPFADGTFDRVLNLGNLEHFLDPLAGIREMRRVLKPDGRAYVLLPNLFYSGAIWRAIMTGAGPNHHQPIDRFATRREWHDLLESQGLRVLRWQAYHKGKWWKWLLPANLAWHFLYETEPGAPSTGGVCPPLTRGF